MNQLQVTEFKNERILTTEQLAEVYNCEASHIKQNFNNNKENFTEGKHYYFLEGSELAEFKRQVDNIDPPIVSKFASSLYLWTERGASRHCKILDTDKAWEQFDNLEATYFNAKNNIPVLDGLSPQLQLLINMEIRQNQLEDRFKATDAKVDSIRDIVALNPNDWRKDSADLINKMAYASGGTDHIQPIRREIYKLLNERMGVDVKRRLTNKRQRMADEGVSKSKRDALTILDVIADDKKLIEGYIAIVKEMAIKHGVAA